MWEGEAGQLRMWNCVNLGFFRLLCQLFPQCVAQLARFDWFVAPRRVPSHSCTGRVIHCRRAATLSP